MQIKVDIKEIHEKKFNQKTICIWFTGLSGAGKSTLAVALQNKLIEEGFITQYLDGDLLRNSLNNNLGFSEADRLENIRRVSEVTKLFVSAGIICINAFISPTNEMRTLARNIIGEENYFEIYLSTTLEACEKRDPKGLYLKVRNGEIKNFTGIDAVFEKPNKSNLILDNEVLTIEKSIEIIYKSILPMIQHFQ